MVNLVNNTAHLIIIDGKMFIPRETVEVNLEQIKAKYPEIESMIQAGQLIVKQAEVKKTAKATKKKKPSKVVASDGCSEDN